MKAFIYNLIADEYKKATQKHPEWPSDIIHASAIVAEESGELTRASLQVTYEKGKLLAVEEEAVQVIVTAIRFLEGLHAGKYK